MAIKKITGFNINTNTMPSAATDRSYTIYGDDGAVFSLQVKDSSGKFYNFNTNAFTTAITSGNTLSNIEVSGEYSGSIVFPAASSGDTYNIFLFAEPHFETELSSSVSLRNKLFLNEELTQDADTYIRFALGSDQASGKFEALYDAADSATYSVATGSPVSNASVALTFTMNVTDPSSPHLGYKCNAPTGIATDGANQTISASLQPIDSDFYTVVSTQTNGTGTDSTSMIIDSVDNLVIGMSLVSIADSSDLEQTGSLGVLTYPTITAIDVANKTVTLSAAPDWGDDKAVSFRAYGSDLIRESTGAVVEFSGFKYSPFLGSQYQAGGTPHSFVVNGAVSGSTSIAVDGYQGGVSAGAYIKGIGVSETSNANLITAVHASGTPITVTGNQTLSDNQKLEVYGAALAIKVAGTVNISKFAQSDTVIYLDLDRGFVLSTTS